METKPIFLWFLSFYLLLFLVLHVCMCAYVCMYTRRPEDNYAVLSETAPTILHFLRQGLSLPLEHTRWAKMGCPVSPKYLPFPLFTPLFPSSSSFLRSPSLPLSYSAFLSSILPSFFVLEPEHRKWKLPFLIIYRL